MVFYNARPYLSLPGSGQLSTTTAVFKNGTLIPGSEAITEIRDFDQSGQDTAGQTFMHTFSSGDTLTLHAYRIGQSGTAKIFSNPDGRTHIMARLAF
ncbi:hypothetical protein [Kitasatospora sp. NRRL B-11411]|uniref:hypothetical protein n=1 Tax=Kitasatospora sp. NRRL B-11411 TaxID=1463822 RepID=UPI0004C37EB9|nr:hypothetical protein [Kitasatospora sp. NRRL B-11411]